MTIARRQLWLMRGIGEKQSLMFSVAVRVEREGDFFAACILNMEDQMAATGRDEDEAFENARLLFTATVDDAIKAGASIQYATGQDAITLDLPIWMAPKFFHLLEQKLMENDTEVPQWISIPASEQEAAHIE
jgi:hypothetical protein